MNLDLQMTMPIVARRAQRGHLSHRQGALKRRSAAQAIIIRRTRGLKPHGYRPIPLRGAAKNLTMALMSRAAALPLSILDAVDRRCSIVPGRRQTEE